MTTIHRIQTTVQLQRAGLDAQARTVPVTLATDRPIKHAGLAVILRHGEDALDLEHVTDDGIPLLVAHNGHSLPIGRLKALHMGEHETTALAYFGRSGAAEEVWQDVQDGTVTDVSVGADPSSTDAVTRMDDDTVLVTRWRPVEGSVVAVGADPKAKIHRSEDTKMAFELANDEARSARTSELRRIFEGLDGPDFKAMHIEALEGADTVEAIRSRVLDKLKTASHKVEEKPRIQTGPDEREKFLEAARASVIHRMGILKGDEAKRTAELSRSSELHGMSLLDIARESCRRSNVFSAGMDKYQTVSRALYTRGIVSHSTSDFASILADASNKALNIGYEEASTTWSTWCATGSLPDFKTAQLSNLSTFSNVDAVPESAEYTYGSFDDKHETAQLQTYGKLFSITRQAIINDAASLDAMSRMPMAIGRAQARKLNQAVYNLLSANAAMTEDAVAIFHANHGNLGTSGVISQTTLTEMDKMFGLQNALGPDGGAQTGAVLNLTPQYLLVPRTIRITAIKETGSIHDPSEGTTTSFEAINPFVGMYTIVSDQAMDANSAAVWYAASSPMQIDTVKVFFLDGQSTPMLEQQEGFTVDGVIFKSRFDWAASVLDFRGLFKNAGV